MNEMPRVSVLLTSYKHERWLRECVDSALAQSHDDLEVIVVDDNSPDSSVAILESYGDRIRLVANKENRGLMASWTKRLRWQAGNTLPC